MFTPSELCTVLLLDLETAPVVSDFSLLSAPMQAAWRHQARRIQDPETPEATAEERFLSHAALYAEFGRIVCLSAAYLNFTPGQITTSQRDTDGQTPELIIRSWCGTDEVALLNGFAAMVRKGKRLSRLCAYNGREFDFPYLAKRMIIHQMPLPEPLNCRDKTSWQLTHLLDPMQLWKFTVWKEYRSLDVLCAVLGIESPKAAMNGSQVGTVFYQPSDEKQTDYEQIARYCENDVIALARLLLRISRLPMLTDAQVIHRPNVYCHTHSCCTQAPDLATLNLAIPNNVTFDTPA
jgi:hypothetical protein